MEKFKEVTYIIEKVLPKLKKKLEKNQKIIITRAPGRLDIMGGIANYSGGLVIEYPLNVGVAVAFTPTKDNSVKISSKICSSVEKKDGECRFNPDEVKSITEKLSSENISNYHQYFNAMKCNKDLGKISNYILGCIYYFLIQHKGNLPFTGGIFKVSSSIPMNAGLGFSGALQVATVQALNVCYNMNLTGEEISQIARKAEVISHGIPTGIMNQTVSTLGKNGQVQIMLCQPDKIKSYENIPDDIQFYGIDSGVRARETEREHRNIRISSEMGYKILYERYIRKFHKEPEWEGYLSRVPQVEYRRNFRLHMPKQLLGKQFMEQYGNINHPFLQVEPDESYMVRSRVEHSIQEMNRCNEFYNNIWGKYPNYEEAGDIMYKSHWSYHHNCKLDTKETQLLVDLCKERGVKEGIFGAKISGEGGGGTVTILASKEADSTIKSIINDYQMVTGNSAKLHYESSDGAEYFDTIII